MDNDDKVDNYRHIDDKLEKDANYDQLDNNDDVNKDIELHMYDEMVKVVRTTSMRSRMSTLTRMRL